MEEVLQTQEVNEMEDCQIGLLELIIEVKEGLTAGSNSLVRDLS